MKECPENTKPNDLNQCLDIKIEKCILSKKDSRLNGIFLNSNVINEMAINFANEFSYTNNHISQFIIDNYLILFYKNKSCLSEFNLESSIIDYDECIIKINNIYNISFPLVAIIDRKGKYNNPSTRYAFFNPITGEKLNTSFCENTNIIIKKNISYLYNIEEYNWLVNQNIDNLKDNSPFYLSLCQHINSLNGKDITLKDRRLLFYPNITPCEESCQYKETNFESLISKCECPFNESIYYLINSNLLEDEFFKLIRDKIFESNVNWAINIENSQLAILLCAKYIFSFKYFIKNVGSFITLVLLIIQIICITLLIYSKFFLKIKKFILFITNLYLNYKKRKKNYFQRFFKKNNKKRKKKSLIVNEKTKTEEIFNTFPLEKSILKQEKEKNKMTSKFYKKNDSKEKIENYLSSFDNSKKILGSFEIKAKAKINNKKEIKNKERRSSIIDVNNINYLKKFNKNEEFTEKDMKEYLSLSLDELDYYDMLKKDKRTFCVYIFNKIVKSQIIFNTFFIIEETNPIYLKIILFTLYIDLFFFFISISIDPIEISNLYYINTKKIYVKFFFERLFKKVIYYYSISIIIKNVKEHFFGEKKTIRSIIKREKDNKDNLISEMNKLIKSIKIRYILFFILDIIIIIISGFYISCFNIAYPNTQYDWIYLSIASIILAQILSAILSFLVACLRFLSIKCKSEILYKFSIILEII